MTTKSKSQDKHKMSEIDDNISKLFDIKKRLGKGAYGIVWKALDKRNNETIAVKKIFDAFRDETDAQRTFREIIFLKAFRNHPNVVKLHNVIKASNNLDIYLVFEYMESDLHNLIKKGTILKDIHKRYVMYQLINAIKYIHSGNVIHRDLKPSNILIDSKCRCKLADFGLARSVSMRPLLGDCNESNSELPIEPMLTDYVATRWYRAPEILVASKRYTKGIDMWSLGCILGEMIRGKPLFQGSSTINQIEKIVSTLPDITEYDIKAVGAGFGSVLLNKQISKEKKTTLCDLLSEGSKDALDLVKSLLVLDPLGRLTATEALNHPYVEKFRNSIPEIELNVDVLPPFRDDVRLTVPEYRSKLYEIVHVTGNEKKSSDGSSKLIPFATKQRDHKSHTHRSAQDKSDIKKQTKLKNSHNKNTTTEDKYQKLKKSDKNDMLEMQQLQNGISNNMIINKSQPRLIATGSMPHLIKREQNKPSNAISSEDVPDRYLQSNILDECKIDPSKSNGLQPKENKSSENEIHEFNRLLNDKQFNSRNSIINSSIALESPSFICTLRKSNSSHRLHRSFTNLNKMEYELNNRDNFSYISSASPVLRQVKSEIHSSVISPCSEKSQTQQPLCYEKRLKKLEEKIERYNNEVKTFCRETTKQKQISPINNTHTNLEEHNFRSTPKFPAPNNTSTKQKHFPLYTNGNHHDTHTSYMETQGNSRNGEHCMNYVDNSSKYFPKNEKEANKYIFSSHNSTQRMQNDQQIRTKQHRSRPISKFI